MDLFAFALSGATPPPAPSGDLWEEPGVTLWGRMWLENLRRICAKYASELKFGEKLLREGRLQGCRVRPCHAQASFTNREGGLCVVNLSVRPLPPDKWPALERVCDRFGAELFTSDEMDDEELAALFGPSAGLLPELSHLTFSCSHCHDPFCLYRAATLLALAEEFDRVPQRLFELRGATRELMLTRAARQASGQAGEVLDEAALEDVFGIELVPDEDD
jgi:uncharacterized Zn finger protein